MKIGYSIRIPLFIRKIFAKIFKTVRLFLGKRAENKSSFINFCNPEQFPFMLTLPTGLTSYINDLPIFGQVSLTNSDVFQYDNVTDETFFKSCLGAIQVSKDPEYLWDKTSLGERLPSNEYPQLWDHFIEASRIPKPWRNAGFHYACFILKENRWSAPSWVWTNAAIGRYYYQNRRKLELYNLADQFLASQLEDGGWIVRYDFNGVRNRLLRTVAPNDSAYICANTILPAFYCSGDEKYLRSAKRCAEWIMQYAHQDYLVHISYDLETQCWERSANIIDIGFTADFFVQMYQATKEDHYANFAGKFLNAYLKTFYTHSGRFATAVDSNFNHRGFGIFTRGHAWALEGLIPYYALTGDPRIKQVIDDVVSLMLNLQASNGAWLHIHRPGFLQLLSGEDCKGTPVLAHALLRWSGFNKDFVDDIRDAVNRAIAWCMRHTATCGLGTGGIFSWNPEGSFAGKDHVSAACIYSNCYINEIIKKSRELSGGSIIVNL